eukprot:gene40167-2889_t
MAGPELAAVLLPLAVLLLGAAQVAGALRCSFDARLSWSAGGTPFVTSCRNYDAGHVVLAYSFPAGAAFPPSLPPAGLLTQFPALTATSLAQFSSTMSWEHDTMQPANRLTLGRGW